MHHRPHSFGPPFGHRHGGFGPGFPFGPFMGPGRGRFGPGRAPRGNVRAAILLLLGERPMHGYELIAELERRSGGVWRPSPGSVYPTLALLEDEGLVVATEEGGKRRFTLTDAGAEQVAGRAEGPLPWDEVAAGVHPSAAGLRHAAARLFGAVVQVGEAGSDQQAAEAVAILDEARRRIYGLLAEDGAQSSSSEAGTGS